MVSRAAARVEAAGPGAVRVAIHLPAFAGSARDLALDVAPAVLRLQAPGHEELQVPWGSLVDTVAAVARWRARRRTLICEAPIAGDSSPAGAAGMGDVAPVEGSGGVVIADWGAFDPSHPTSQLMMEWIREVAAPSGWLRGAVLDYGCGTGVLGLCALRHGAASVVGTDLDRRALRATSANAAANGVSHLLALRLPPSSTRRLDFVDFFGSFEEEWHAQAARNTAAGGDVPSLDPDRPESEFACVLANMRKNALLRHARTLVRMCRPGGVLAISGFMVDFEERAVVGAFREAGLEIRVMLDAPSFEEMGDIRSSRGYGVLWGFRPVDALSAPCGI